MRIHGKLVGSGFLRTGYHFSAAHLVLVYCVLCEWGSRPWMWEPSRGIHPTPSNTISYIPHRSGRIRWPRLLFCVVSSHTARHCILFYPVPLTLVSRQIHSHRTLRSSKSNLQTLSCMREQREDKMRDSESIIWLFGLQFNNMGNLPLSKLWQVQQPSSHITRPDI